MTTESKPGLGVAVISKFRLLLDRFSTARSGETPQTYLKGGVFLEVHPQGGEKILLTVGKRVVPAHANDAVYRLNRWGLAARRFIAGQSRIDLI